MIQDEDVSRLCAVSAGHLAAQLNDGCHCITVDRSRLMAALGRADDPHALAALLVSHPHLFSDHAMFVTPGQVACMERLITAIERVVALPAWQWLVLKDAPVNARVPTATQGMFLGYDFHLGAQGPQLIEINTNAGGPLLNAALHAAQIACCVEVQNVFGVGQSAQAEADFVAMFRAEWALARGPAAARTVSAGAKQVTMSPGAMAATEVPPLGRDGIIAIVDDDPATQFLLPEFERFVALLAAQGWRARIVDASKLHVRDDALWYDAAPDGSERVDFVYNRLTDFSLSEPRHNALAQAWQRDLAVITPHPRVHALYADKRHLALLTDAACLRGLGVEEEAIAVLQAGIPATVVVAAANAAHLWATRKQWFFKPATGYGSKAAYRGDKLTQRKWQDILAAVVAGDAYVAQRFVLPSERSVRVEGVVQTLKVDIRNYVYAGQVQLLSARLYQGQTTNFRTPGGGFAAVFAVPE